MTIAEFVKKLKQFGACREAIDFALKYDDIQVGWEECRRGEWMLWLIGKLSGKPGSEKRKRFVLAVCECTRPALKYVPADENRPLAVIETAEAWAMGRDSVTLDNVKEAAIAAEDAAGWDIDAVLATIAAGAVAQTAIVADSGGVAAFAANAAADTIACTAVNAAVAAAVDTDTIALANEAGNKAKQRILAKCAIIVRKHYPYIEDLFKDVAKFPEDLQIRDEI